LKEGWDLKLKGRREGKISFQIHVSIGSTYWAHQVKEKLQDQMTGSISSNPKIHPWSIHFLIKGAPWKGPRGYWNHLLLQPN
jgi:hypothetical protein